MPVPSSAAACEMVPGRADRDAERAALFEAARVEAVEKVRSALAGGEMSERELMQATGMNAMRVRKGLAGLVGAVEYPRPGVARLL